MSNIPSTESSVRAQVLGMVWQWTYENFHKFTDANKIKVSISLMGKNIPQQIDQNITVTQMPDITIDGRPLELRLGQPQNRITGDVSYSGEAVTDN